MRRALTIGTARLAKPSTPSTQPSCNTHSVKPSPIKGSAPLSRKATIPSGSIGEGSASSSSVSSERKLPKFSIKGVPRLTMLANNNPAPAGLVSPVNDDRSVASGSRPPPPPSLSQAEMDSLVDGISFDDDLSFEMDSLFRQSNTTTHKARPPTPTSAGPRSPSTSPPARSAAPPRARQTTPTKRKSAIVDTITLSPDSPVLHARYYASSARRRDGFGEPRLSPPRDVDRIEGTLGTLPAFLDAEGSCTTGQEVLELSDDSDDLPPIEILARRAGKENVAPKAEVKVTTRTFAVAPKPTKTNAKGTWLAELAASQMSGLVARQKSGMPPLIASAKRALRTAPVAPPVPGPQATPVAQAKPAAAVGPAGKRSARGPVSTKLSKAAKDREKQAQLALIHPQFRFEAYPQNPRMVYSISEEEIARELAGMQGPLGFDIEWEPYVFTKGQPARQGPTALAQVCDERTILLIHCARMPAFSPSLRALIEDPTRIKLGVQIAGDGQKMIRDGFVSNPRGMLELNHVAKEVDATHKATNSWGLVGLQALVAKYLSRHLLKEASVRTGKWASKLGETQMKYAANDVYSSLLVHLHLKSLAPQGTDVEALATGFGAALTGAADGGEPAPATTSKPRALPKPKPAAALGATPRQLEAYKLLAEDGLSLAKATEQMCLTRQIKPLSVAWNFLGALDHSKPPLKYDPAMVLAVLARAKGPSKQMMLDEFEDLIGRITKEAGV